MLDLAWRLLILLARQRASLATTHEFLDYVEKLKGNVIRLFWALVSLISWDSQLIHGDCQPPSILQINCPMETFRKILVSCVWASVMLLIQTIIINRIAYNFHQVAYKDRLEKNRFATTVIESLRQKIQSESVKSHSGGFKAKTMDQILSLGKKTLGSNSNVSTSASREDIFTATEKTHSSTGGIFHELHDFVKHFHIFKNDDHRLGTGGSAISADQEKRVLADAKQLALNLFNQLLDRANARIQKVGGTQAFRDHLTLSDFEPFFANSVFGPLAAFSLFDNQQTGLVYRQDFKTVIVSAFRETLNLSKYVLSP